MNDSELDFVDLCSKLLKRVRKKPAETKQTLRAEQQASSQTGDGDKRRRNHKKHGASGSKCTSAASGDQPVCTGTDRAAVSGGTGREAGNAGSSVCAAAETTAEGGLRAKDKVLSRMRQFKRESPQKMVHKDKSQATGWNVSREPSAQLGGGQAPPSSPLHLQPVDSDEALALQLQQELDLEVAQNRVVNLEDGGLFFCQICQRDLSHMTPGGRTQHINRCLDLSEHHTPAPPPPPGVPDCPICGKRFKSQKSRSVHLKRCSSDMGVAPAVLLQVLQRQAEETQSATAATASAATNCFAQTAGPKRKGASKPGVPLRKKPRKKTDPLDEDTMVALALSSSLQEQQKEKEAESNVQPQPVDNHTSVLKWCPDAGKVRGKRRKAAAPRPPPLLLVQDAEVALTRLQERVSDLLLRTRARSPPTPTRCPSSLPGWSGAAPLWQKSALLNGSSTCLSEFYTSELREFISPRETAATHSSSTNQTLTAPEPVFEGTSVTDPVSSQPSSSQTGQLSVGGQALQDLMDLAEDGMTLTQFGYAAPVQRDSLSTNLSLSGFVPSEVEEQADMCASGFLPDHTHTSRVGAAERSSQQQPMLCKLACDLSSMVNNPQLSDVQLQVDSGEIFYAHSFMVFARCPLLAQLVHEGAFRVQEDDAPASQRVLVPDVPGAAVLALLQFLYTAGVSIPGSLQPHVLELASRFDVKELQQLCEQQRDEAGGGERVHVSLEEHLSPQTDQVFIELLQSVWTEEDEQDEGAEADGGRAGDVQRDGDNPPGDGEVGEEQVNEEELDEIYEFAATQRKREEESGDEEEDDGENRLQLQAGVCCKSESDSHPGLEKVREKVPLSVPLETFTSSYASKLSSRTLLQSSASVVEEVLLSSPPTTSNLPVAGLSPAPPGVCGAGGDQRLEAAELSPVPTVPGSPQKTTEPELIVLSDSSEEADVPVVGSRGASQTVHTQITDPSEMKGTLIHHPSPAASASDPDLEDFSPEVSWLVPSTPVHSGPSRTICCQTRSSMCRTQLFPQGDTASLASSDLSPLAPPGVLTRVGPAGVGVPGSQLDRTLPLCPLSSSVLSRDRRTTSLRLRRGSLEQDLPPHSKPRPCSSTPLHTDVLRSTPPLCSGPHGTSEGPHESGSFHMSISSSASSHGAQRDSSRTSPPSPQRSQSPPSPQRSQSPPSPQRSQSPPSPQRSQSPPSPQRSQSPPSPLKLVGTGQVQDGGGGGGEEEDADVSFQQSFMDEPPIAFNDSWGLDACEGSPVNLGRFSLRLDDSRGSGPNPGDGSRSGSSDAASSGRHLQSVSVRGRVSNSSTSGHSGTPSPATTHGPVTHSPPEIRTSLLDSRMWDSWEEEEEDLLLPLSQRLKPPEPFKTPDPPRSEKQRRSLQPVTPMPHYSDMDTPELKNKLTRFGVRPLPKRQMILKLREIHQYTHQLVDSDSEDESESRPGSSVTHTVTFKDPPAPSTEDAEPLSASQESNASSTAASEESERSNPELCASSDSDSDVSASQATTRLEERLRAVRTYILSDSLLYSQILQYRPLVLSQLQQRLKAAGIRLGAAKLVDYLDSQCITFTTAKPGHAAPTRRRGRKPSRGAKTAGGNR